MTELSLQLDVQSQEALVNSFAQSLERVAANALKTDNASNNLGDTIKKSTNSVTAAAFSFNEMKTALEGVLGYVEKAYAAFESLVEVAGDAANMDQLFKFRGASEEGIKSLKDTKAELQALGVAGDSVDGIMRTLTLHMDPDTVQKYASKLVDLNAATGGTTADLEKLVGTVSKLNFREIVDEKTLLKARDLFPGVSGIDDIFKEIAKTSGKDLDVVKAEIKSKKIKFSDLFDMMGSGTEGAAMEALRNNPALQLNAVKTQLSEIQETASVAFGKGLGTSLLRLNDSFREINEGGLGKFISQYMQIQGDKFAGSIDAASDSLDAINDMFEDADKWLTTLKADFEDVFGTDAKNKLGTFGDVFTIAFLQPVENILKIPWALKYMFDFSTTLFDVFVSEMIELATPFYKIGENIVDGIINGMKSAWTQLSTIVTEFKDDLVKKFESAFQIHSPSLVMNKEIGVHLAAGTLQPLNDIGSQISKTVDMNVSAPDLTQFNKSLSISSPDALRNFDISGGMLQQQITNNSSSDSSNIQPIFQMTFQLPGGVANPQEYATAVVDNITTMTQQQSIRKALAGWK